MCSFKQCHILTAAVGHRVTVFDQCAYDDTAYVPGEDPSHEAASVDHNKIVSRDLNRSIAFDNDIVLTHQDAIIVWQQDSLPAACPGKS